MHARYSAFVLTILALGGCGAPGPKNVGAPQGAAPVTPTDPKVDVSAPAHPAPLDPINPMDAKIAKPEPALSVKKVPWNYNFALASRGGTATGPRRAELLIDGNSTTYDGGEGYAESDWTAKPPVPMVIGLREPQIVNTARFLLWDGDPRFYRYKLEISADKDGENWMTVSDHSTTGEFKGWQVIAFPEQAVQRFRLTGTYNSSNSGFHVVEFQVFRIPEGFTPRWEEKKTDQMPGAESATGSTSSEF